MQTAHFNNIREEIISLLNNANSEVLIAMAWFTSKELFDALIDCRKRAVKVDLVLLDNAINWTDYAPDFNRLIEADGIVRIARTKNGQKGQMHHKFCVIDSKTAITGSYNWTYYAEKYNNENIIITDEKDIIPAFKSEFQNLTEQFSPVSECPKLSWENIENSIYDSDIDFYELNNEIDSYVDFYPTADRKRFETTIKQVEVKKGVQSSEQDTTPKPTHIVTKPVVDRFNPISAFDIGIQATNVDGDNNYLMPIIKKGNKLPKIGKFTFNNFLETRNNLECKIYYGNSSKATDNQLLIRQMVKEITDGRKDEKLQIMIQFTLIPDGELYAEIRCLETGKATEIKVTNSKLVTNQS